MDKVVERAYRFLLMLGIGMAIAFMWAGVNTATNAFAALVIIIYCFVMIVPLDD